jgi:hypothetical protein
MKKNFTSIKKTGLFVLTGLLLLFSQQGRSGEFVIINKQVTYSADANAFSNTVKDFSTFPSNWSSPDDYFNGMIYAYYEVIDVPTNVPFKMQVGIFQYYPDKANQTGNFSESCSGTADLQGIGSIAKYSGRPSTWWSPDIYGPVDFSRVNDFESVGPVLWGTNPDAILFTTNGGGNDATWAQRANWLPCTVKVIIVAVSAGSTFSGWDYYLGTTPGSQQPTPNYSIAYGYENTNSVVPSTDEYSYNSNMSGAVSGNGSKLSLTPGVDVYFRTKAGNGLDASEIQHLVVPARPAKPTFNIDFANEMTLETVNNTVAYSASPSYSNPVNGSGTKITLTPGQDLYLWTKSTSSSFASTAYHLIVPNRPEAPAVTLDFSNEITSAIASTEEWSESETMASAATGTNAGVSLAPGTSLYIRVKATSSAFASLVQTLDVPERPAVPAYQVDYISGKTVQAVPATDEYSTSADMSGASTGSNAALDLTPGTDLYFRTKSTESSFSSEIQHLVVSSKPEAPVIHIDFENETTAEVINSEIEYAATADFSGAASGTGVVNPVTPGQNQYFRTKATESSFAGSAFLLEVPARPVLEYNGEAVVTTALITIQAVLDETMTGFELTDLEITNGNAQNLQAGNIFDVIPEAEGDVVVKIPFNALGGASFASNSVTVNYNMPTGISQNEENHYSIYPNPSSTGILTIQTSKSLPYSIGVYSINGNLIRTVEMNSGKCQQLNLQDLSKGSYYIKITENGKTRVEKIILE